MSDSLLISDARHLLPKKNGRLIHIHTIRRWIAKGLSVNGRMVRLKSERVGARLMTREDWIDEFIQDCSRTEPAPLPRRSGGKSAAERFLELEYGNVSKKQMLGQVRSKRRGQGSVSGLPSRSTARHQNKQGDRAGVDRASIDAAEVCGSTI